MIFRRLLCEAAGLSSSLELSLTVATAWVKELEQVESMELRSFVAVGVACCSVGETGVKEMFVCAWGQTSSWRNDGAGGEG